MAGKGKPEAGVASRPSPRGLPGTLGRVQARTFAFCSRRCRSGLNTEALVTILVVAMIVVVVLLLIRAATSRRRAPNLRPLTSEARERYIDDWDGIEAKFVDSPEQAVREAEALVMSVLRERGHPLTDRDLPDESRRAHRLAYSSRDRTEGMRQALLEYRALMERMLGPQQQGVRTEPGRRELA
jgi:hypothetical protein